LDLSHSSHTRHVSGDMSGIAPSNDLDDAAARSARDTAALLAKFDAAIAAALEESAPAPSIVPAHLPAMTEIGADHSRWTKGSEPGETPSRPASRPPAASFTVQRSVGPERMRTVDGGGGGSQLVRLPARNRGEQLGPCSAGAREVVDLLPSPRCLRKDGESGQGTSAVGPASRGWFTPNAKGRNTVDESLLVTPGGGRFTVHDHGSPSSPRKAVSTPGLASSLHVSALVGAAATATPRGRVRAEIAEREKRDQVCFPDKPRYWCICSIHEIRLTGWLSLSWCSVMRADGRDNGAGGAARTGVA